MGSSIKKPAPKASKAAAKKSAPTKAVVKAVKKPVPAPKVSKAPAVVKKTPPVPTKSRKSVQSSPVVSSPSASPDPRATAPIPLASFEPTIDEGANPGFILSNEVLDEAEQAQMLQLQEQATISYRAREMNRPETHPDFDGVHCVDCDDPLSTLRLSMCRVRCVHCQEMVEEEAKRLRRTMG